MGLRDVKDVVLSNNPTGGLEGSTDVDGASQPFKNLGDPVDPTDGVNLRTLQNFVLGLNTVTYVNQPDDWSATTVTKGSDEYYVLNTGIYIVTGSVSATDKGLTFEAGANVVIISLNILNSLEDFNNFNNEKCPVISMSGSGTQSFIYSDDANYPSFLQIKGVAFKDLSGFINNDLFNMVVTTNDMFIVIDNIYTGFYGQDALNNLGIIDGGTSDTRLIIKNSILYGSQLGNVLELKNIKYCNIFNNNGGVTGAGNGKNFFGINGSNTLSHIYNNNSIQDFNTSAVSNIFNILNDIPVNAKIVVANHTIGVKTNASYFNAAGLDGTDARVTVKNSEKIADSYRYAMAYDNSNTAYAQDPFTAIDLHQIYDTLNLATWVTDTDSLSGFVVTVEAIPVGDIPNGSKAAAQAIVIQSIIPYEVTVEVWGNMIINGPGNTDLSLGIFLNQAAIVGGGYNPVLKSYVPHQDGTPHFVSTTTTIKMNYQDKVTLGVLTTNNPTGNFDTFNPRLSIKKL